MEYKEGKLLIEKKTDDFRNHKNIYLSKTFDETENRTHFINPLFQALGWDFEQTNIPYHLWDVHQEFSQKDKKRKTKKPDYAFRLDKKVKFFVEAKAPWVPLTEKEPVFQAKSYAFSTNGKAPIVILTDFEEFRVFNALERPIFDNPLQGLLKDYDLTYEDYLDKWDLLYDAFSKEAVFNNSIENLRGKITKNTKTLDKDFLETLMSWRKDLAMRIAYDNKELTEPQLNECVQRILDRLIFIRNLEDREIENNIDLINLLDTKEPLYPRLIPIFNSLDASYNGLLFHKHISENINVDDKTIRNIVKNLYPNLSPFQFDAIEPEILGRIYEKFLGSKIYLTQNHQGKVKEKPEVVHAKGVYYTPQWVVDIIIENTLGTIVKNKNPEQILKIKILDPACGSGSFLLGAYDYLINYHKDWYSKNLDVKKYQDDYYKNQNNEIVLTNAKKSEILKNNIFGVDIDREATEVAIMSLYLKALEEGVESTQLEMFKKGSILPEMTSNIKCGNSLITRDQLFENDMFGDEDIQPFDWKDEAKGFGKIFKDNHGFDCIVGNPPYIRIQELQKWAPKEAGIYKKCYKSGESGNFDIYVLFIEKSLSLLNESGLFGMILPNKFHMADYGENIRKIINKKVYQIVNFGDQQVFENATTYTNLLFLSHKEQNNFKYTVIHDLNGKEEIIHELVQNKDLRNDYIEIGNVINSDLSEKPWYFIFESDKIFYNKIISIETKLKDITINISQGFKTGSDKIFIHDFKDTFLNEKTFIKVLKGEDIQRYSINFKNRYSIFPYDKEGKPLPEKIFKEISPETYDYLKTNKNILMKRDGGKPKAPVWFCFSRTQFISLSRQPKIITRDIADIPSFTYDENGDYGLMGGYGIILNTDYDLSYYYLLGILNSNVVNKFIRIISSRFRGGFYSYEARFINHIPIYIPNKNDKLKYDKCMQIEKMVKQILEFNKNENKKDDALFLEKKIDELVEEIYLSE